MYGGAVRYRSAWPLICELPGSKTAVVARPHRYLAVSLGGPVAIRAINWDSSLLEFDHP
jgi:hypothetical protein